MATTIAAPTYQDLFNVGRAEAQARRPDLTFDVGDIAEFYTAAGAAMADHLIGYVSQRVRETFLDGAEEDALTTLADDRYNIQRAEASFATGVQRFTRLSGVLVGTIFAGTVIATVKDTAGNEVQFVTDSDLGFGAGELTKTVNVTAAVAGVRGNVAAGTATRLISVGLFDTFTTTNTARMAGGNEQESDDSLRQRCRDYVTTLRRGTLAAIEYGAKTVPGVAVASAVEGITGIVSLYVADSSGSSSPSMIAAVAAEILNWRAAGVIVNVYGGQVFTVTGGIVVSLTTRPGVSSAAIAADIKASIVSRVNKLRLGEALTDTLIKQAVGAVDPDGITNVTVTSPVGTVDPGADGLIRITLGEITVS